MSELPGRGAEYPTEYRTREWSPEQRAQFLVDIHTRAAIISKIAARTHLDRFEDPHKDRRLTKRELAATLVALQP